ncbi:KxYKxGKxW signal peptide domain-containing protein [Lactiplantibacillus plantarum]|nr:KxYKxGKxW signal peptide domain-containing protein [Lactiplantibacillus plantarum]MEA5158050.1 KxYKxGKxW signal peptide domain-containing protein [Lactiplantibacillus plantarum]
MLLEGNKMQKRRLQRARLTEKRAYKMYKKGRLWLVAGLSTFTLETGLYNFRRWRIRPVRL